MKKSLLSVLLFVVVLMAVALKVLTKNLYGPLILLAMAALIFVLTFAIEFLKVFGPGRKNLGKTDGKKVQG